MRSFPRISFAIILIIVLSISLAFAWTEPVEIGHGMYLAAPRVVAVGETLYVIAVAPPKAYYLYSRDNGATWSEPVMPIDTSRRMEMPTIKYSNGRLHLIWSEKNRPLYYDLFHSQSSDGGRNWSRPNMVFINSAFRDVAYSTLATNGDTLFVAFKIDDLIQFRGFIFFKSFDAGQTWQDSIMIDQGEDLGIFQYPHLLYSNGILQFIYPLLTGNDSFGVKIYYKRSTDLGLSWTDREFLSPVGPFPYNLDSQDPSAAIDSDGHTLATWMDYANGSMCGISGDIFYRVSLDNGATWDPWGSITNTQSGRNSSNLIVGNRFIVGWDDFWLLGCEYSKEAYSFSSDLGQTWQDPQFISDSQVALETQPALAYTFQGDDTIVHYFYDRYVTGTRLYYMRDQDFVGIDERNPSPPIANLSLEAYPNAFKGSTMITLNNPKGGDVELEIYNLLGQRIWHRSINGKEASIIWDASDMDSNGISSGTYFVRATTGRNICSIKLLYLK